MILLDNKKERDILEQMSYDGRKRSIPWANQNIDVMGYHYYMTPETAVQGIDKFYKIKYNKPKIWDNKSYPDLSKMRIFYE